MKDDIFNLSTKEFFELLSQKKTEIKHQNDIYNSYIRILKQFCGKKNGYYLCYQEKMNNYLKNKEGEEKLKRLLKLSLGPELFNHTDLENKFLDEKGILTKNDIINILKPSINKGYIKEPNSYTELVDAITLLGKKVKYENDIYPVLDRFDGFFTSTYKELEDNYYKNETIICTIDDILKLYNAKKEIDLDKISKLTPYFNDNSVCVKINDDGSKEELNANFGDLLISYITNYNNEVLSKKKKNIIKSKSDSYFKKLKKKDKSELTDVDFPSYDDEDANSIYNMLLTKTLEKGKKNSDILDLHTIISIMYMRYCKFKDESNNISISKQGR